VEFADFECPYSHESEQILKKVLDKYKGTVRLAFLDFPLKKIHPLAERAAEASRCAAEQGKFWEYHDLLLAKNGRVDPDGLREHAKTAGLDIDRFEACLANHELAGQVERDVLAGYRSGVSATPTFFINGIAVVGVQTASSFESVIESELRDATVKKSAP
jgi:protein-disulfide isomerase